jgi:LmbE family N-acetylglucosaminyl deacetylase
VWVVAAFLRAASVEAAELPAPQLVIDNGERLLVVAPHPDDEMIAAAGLIQRVMERGGTVRVVFVTAGDGYVEAVVHETGELRPRAAQYVAYGKRRWLEAHRAARALGGKGIALELLGYPDGGLDDLLTKHSNRGHPEQSQTTEAKDPPYADAVEPDVPYDGVDLRRQLRQVIRDTRPSLVLLPAPSDRHPDHRAAGLFTLLALTDLQPELSPRLYEYLVHWPAWPPAWSAPHSTPQPAPESALLLLPPNLVLRGAAELLVLTPPEVERKRAALAAYRTQQEVMPSFLAAFVRRTEPLISIKQPQLADLTRMIQTRPTPLQRLR